MFVSVSDAFLNCEGAGLYKLQSACMFNILHLFPDFDKKNLAKWQVSHVFFSHGGILTQLQMEGIITSSHHVCSNI